MNEELITVFRDNCAITKRGCYTVESQKCKLPEEDYSCTVYIPPEASENMLHEAAGDVPRRIERCSFSVSGKDSFTAARELAMSSEYRCDAKASRVLVLNFANSVHPGGGVRFGARAQEEDLCRKSTLYASLTSADAEAYYAGHARHYSPLASHTILLSPNVAIFRGDVYELLKKPVMAAVLTCAAPIAHERGDMSNSDYEALLYERIRRILAVAAHYRYNYLVLGAWGCGAFGNDAKLVAALFKRAFREFRCGDRTASDLFHSVVFAVRSNVNEPTYNFKAFQDHFWHFYWDEDAAEKSRAEAIRKEPCVIRDRIRGSLIGGAAGDALGYPVEFMSLREIKKHYGSNGITDYSLDPGTGEALISDDTQMTLFTANGVLFGETRGCLRGIMGPIESYVHLSYKDWLRTQTTSFKPWTASEDRFSWLLDIPDLYSRRAPGNTCMGSLRSGGSGSTTHSINNSKGCGGVMRVAPLGLHTPATDRRKRAELDRTGAEIAALTHSHPLGWLPAALLTHIVNMGVYDECSIREAVEDALETVEIVFSDILSEMDFYPMKTLLKKAIQLSENERPDTENIRELGSGWTGDEALAIAVYCALRHSDDFSDAIIAAVNHSGDSDSTGAITGNIMGAWVGYNAIDEKWKLALELKDVIMEMAEDLFKGCQIEEYHEDDDPIWSCKYVYCRHATAEKEALEKENEAIEKMLGI